MIAWLEFHFNNPPKVIHIRRVLPAHFPQHRGSLNNTANHSLPALRTRNGSKPCKAADLLRSFPVLPIYRSVTMSRPVRYRNGRGLPFVGLNCKLTSLPA